MFNGHWSIRAPSIPGMKMFSTDGTLFSTNDVDVAMLWLEMGFCVYDENDDLLVTCIDDLLAVPTC